MKLTRIIAPKTPSIVTVGPSCWNTPLGKTKKVASGIAELTATVGRLKLCGLTGKRRRDPSGRPVC